MSTPRSRDRRPAVRVARRLAGLGMAGAAVIGGVASAVAIGGASPASRFVEVEPDGDADGMGDESVDPTASGFGLDWVDDWFDDFLEP